MSGSWVRRVAVAGVAVLALAACGKSSNGSNAGQGGGASSGSTGDIGTVKISGVGTVLDDSKGFTLYHLTSESASNIQCTGGCATTWPPFMAPGGNAPSATGLTGKLGTVTRPDGGVQVTYNGFPLYRYSGDSAPGQANGQGISGVWFAVSASGSGSGASPSSGGGGYGSGGYGS